MHEQNRGDGNGNGSFERISGRMQGIVSEHVKLVTEPMKKDIEGLEKTDRTLFAMVNGIKESVHRVDLKIVELPTKVEATMAKLVATNIPQQMPKPNGLWNYLKQAPLLEKAFYIFVVFISIGLVTGGLTFKGVLKDIYAKMPIKTSVNIKAN